MKKIVLAPYIDQTDRWVNGCESISAVMLLQAMGIRIDPDTFIERDLPHAPYWEQDGKLYGPDPWQVYPGDPHDHTGYGCYAPCIVRALNSALEHEGAAGQFEVVDESGKTAAELVRAGILAVDKGQMEAGRSLGLNKFQTMRYIIIPQAFKSILPPLGNEFIVLIKETSIVGYVGMSDLTRVANQMTSKLFDVFTPLLGIAFIYFVLTKVLSILLAKLERRLRKSDNR